MLVKIPEGVLLLSLSNRERKSLSQPSKNLLTLSPKYLAVPEDRHREVLEQLKLPFPKLKHLEAEAL